MRCANFFIAVLAGWLAFSAHAGAQQPDTLAATKLLEVEIIARRPEAFAAGSRQTILDSAFLQTNHAASLAEILQKDSPVYVKNYGQGMLATLAFRGTTASHTAVIWNGFNLSLPTVGQTDFSQIPVSGLKSISLQHGSAGSNFGSGAIGGSVLLKSPDQVSAGLKLQAQQDIGSFGQVYSKLGGSFGWEKAGLEATVFRSFARNDFAFTNTAKFGSPEEKQQNATVAQTGFTLNGYWKPTEKSSLHWQNWYTDQENEVQPNMVAANTHARMLNRNYRSTASWNLRSGWGETSVRGAFFQDFMRYSDDMQPISDTDLHTWQAQLEHAIPINKQLNLNLGSDLQYFTGQVDGYKKPVSERRNSVFALLRFDPSRKVSMNLNWRQAFVPGFNPPPVPTAGFKFKFLEKQDYTVSWKANVARGYRVPTLNDRYWPPGNDNLLPENSWNYESGLRLETGQQAWTTETELTAYTLYVDNWIQWVPAENRNWKPLNLKKVHAAGFEFSGKITYRFSTGNLNLHGNYAFTRSVQQTAYGFSGEPLHKQLVYTPLHTASALAMLHLQNWDFSLNGTYTGQRFTDAENEIALPGYWLLNGSAGKNVVVGKCRFQLIGRLNNVMNTTYQNLQYYAMPGRNYSVSLRFHFN